MAIQIDPRVVQALQAVNSNLTLYQTQIRQQSQTISEPVANQLLNCHSAIYLLKEAVERLVQSLQRIP